MAETHEAFLIEFAKLCRKHGVIVKSEPIAMSPRIVLEFPNKKRVDTIFFDEGAKQLGYEEANAFAQYKTLEIEE